MDKNYLIWCVVLSFGLSASGDPVTTYCESPGEEKVLTAGFMGRYGDFELHFNNCNITSIKLGAFNDVDCQTLDLADNKIRNIDVGSFDSLNVLRYLYLTNNKLNGEDLDREIFRNIKILEVLSLSGNNMTGAPENLLQASSISRIELENCSLYDVPAFIKRSNKKLARIILTGNHLQKLDDPNTFSRLPELWLLDLSRNNIDFIHENLLKENKNLRFVFLKHNKIQHLPEKLFQSLPHLHDVDLRDNLLTTLPANGFIATTLETLYVSHNRITSLPQNFTVQFTVGPKIYKSRVGMKFDHNPWQCACKREFLREAREWLFIYEDSEEDACEKALANEKEEIPCTGPEDLVCHREGTN